MLYRDTPLALAASGRSIYTPCTSKSISAAAMSRLILFTQWAVNNALVHIERT